MIKRGNHTYLYQRIKFDFNRFPHREEYFKTLPEKIQTELLPYVILTSRHSKRTILEKIVSKISFDDVESQIMPHG